MKKYTGKCIGGPLNGQMLTRPAPIFNIGVTKTPYPIEPGPLDKIPATTKSVIYEFMPGPWIHDLVHVRAYNFWMAVDEMPGLKPVVELFREMMDNHDGCSVED